MMCVMLIITPLKTTCELTVTVSDDVLHKQLKYNPPSHATYILIFLKLTARHKLLVDLVKVTFVCPSIIFISSVMYHQPLFKCS